MEIIDGQPWEFEFLHNQLFGKGGSSLIVHCLLEQRNFELLLVPLTQVAVVGKDPSKLSPHRADNALLVVVGHAAVVLDETSISVEDRISETLSMPTECARALEDFVQRIYGK